MVIHYQSTNRNIPEGFKKRISFKDALFQGMAPDNGLFIPTETPIISINEINELKGKPYWEVAYTIISKFEIIDQHTLMEICKDAYDFEIPIETLNKSIKIMRLDRGPTASFKDFAALLMARLMQKLRTKNKITILVATSGDTGSAMGEAFHNLKGTRLYILYPENEVSPTQKKQLDSIEDNVQAISVKGKFDDCQNLVKNAFSDPNLSHLNLTSANSINIGRILPQIVYYFYAYANTGYNIF